jgi:ATP-dependent DNA helicase RecG
MTAIAPPSLALTTSIADLPGMTGPRAAAFRKLGLRCVADLVRHFPLRYEHEFPEQTIGQVNQSLPPEHGSEANIAVRGEITTIRAAQGRRPRIEATLEDGTGTLKIAWFNSPWVRPQIHVGLRIRATGRARRWGDQMQIINPHWSAINPAAPPDEVRAERMRPVYPATEELPSEAIEKVIGAVLDPAMALIDDHLHEAYRRRRELPALAASYRMMHRPADQREIDEARRRLAFDELLLLQLGVMLKRQQRRSALHAPALRHNAAIDAHIRARLPFTLTEAQSEAVAEIAADLTQAVPMNRLLQGDVGSGKTAVAVYAMLMAVASKHQAALMAPTELLAEQHFRSISELLQGGRVSIALLTGSLGPSQRAAVQRRAAAGEIDLLIGTHALLTERVRFKSLAVAVIDEQHRFGVHQRATLRAKAGDAASSPHVLVMTATPIPRTLSLTVFGDLDLSTIRGTIPGRRPVITRVVRPEKAPEVYAYVADRVAQGLQAYVVVPAIDESERGLKDVRTHYRFLEEGPFRGRRLAAMHGRLKAETREAIMHRFRAGRIDVLVATTVIEVGVDVPNASIMVIEHADRFGLAQLHQLRGRVGRGSKQSLCVLIGDPATADGKARLEAIAAMSDGFEIAEKDMELRGPGELFGSKQAGAAPFIIAEFPRDLELLQMARRDAIEWLHDNPGLAGAGGRDALLRTRLLKAHGKALGLGDVA